MNRTIHSKEIQIKILVSGCLLGDKCAYDGKARTNNCLLRLCQRHECLSICPEMEGGLPCPRECHEITGGTGTDVLKGGARLISRTGENRTDEFIRGAEKALMLAEQEGITRAVLRSRSPSCGKYHIYSGSFNNKLKKGSGVTSSLLMENGIEVFNEEEAVDLI